MYDVDGGKIERNVLGESVKSVYIVQGIYSGYEML